MIRHDSNGSLASPGTLPADLPAPIVWQPVLPSRKGVTKHKLLTDFMAVLPADKPKYLMMIMLDEPQPTPETHGFATAGWNSAPTAAKVIARIAPLLDLEPRFNLPKADQWILAKATASR